MDDQHPGQRDVEPNTDQYLEVLSRRGALGVGAFNGSASPVGSRRQSSSETRMTLTRTTQAARKAITALGLAAGLFLAATSAAYADGLTTMHGAACKPEEHDPNVTYAATTGLWNHGSEPINVSCPLTSAWGGGISDIPQQMVSAQVHYLTDVPGSALVAKMHRLNTSGGILETKTATAIDWSAMEKIVTFGSFKEDLSEWNHEYFIEIVLPANSALLNVNFQTKAHTCGQADWYVGSPCLGHLR
jgi:hypothetical protein